MQVAISTDILARQTVVSVVRDTNTGGMEQLVKGENGRDEWTTFEPGQYPTPYASFRSEVWDAVRAQIEAEIVKEHRTRTPALGDRDAERVDVVLTRLLDIVEQRQGA